MISRASTHVLALVAVLVLAACHAGEPQAPLFDAGDTITCPTLKVRTAWVLTVRQGPDFLVCEYRKKIVGVASWGILPEIGRAAHDKVAILLVPIAFVSEHSETLVELDVEYREVAEEEGVPGYFRVPAQNSDRGFIAALAGLAKGAVGGGRSLCSFAGARQCPRQHGDCPHARAKAAALAA